MNGANKQRNKQTKTKNKNKQTNKHQAETRKMQTVISKQFYSLISLASVFMNGANEVILSTGEKLSNASH